jgi:hypothetical protein
MMLMRRWVWGLLLIFVILVSSVALIYGQEFFTSTPNAKTENDEFYFGVTLAQPSVQAAEIQIDRVKNFTNFIVIASWDITTNESILNDVCDYAYHSNLKFIVYFDYISHVIYPWHSSWLDQAKQRWGTYFLGVYLQDELGGRQIDTNATVTYAFNYTDAADKFVKAIATYNSTILAKSKDIPLFISDYALYWYDYLGGYDTVFAELGWHLNTTQQIALCRGAANMQDKDWGVIIDDAPSISGPLEMSQNMLSAYEAGVKYMVVFNNPTYPNSSQCGSLSEAYLSAMQSFWSNTQTHPRQVSGETLAQVALVLPSDYGWGMRRNQYITSDRIWGLWPEDDKAPMILENANKLIGQYGLKLDIVYEDENFSVQGKYSTVYFWNSTIP